MSIVTIDPQIAREKFLKAPFALKHGLTPPAMEQPQ